LASAREERLRKAIVSALEKYPSTYDCSQSVVRKLLAQTLARDILAWYENKHE